MTLVRRLLGWLERRLVHDRDRAQLQRLAGRCMFHDRDEEYWCPEPAVDGSFCWEHRTAEYEDDRTEWDDEDEPRVWWRYR